MLLGLLSGVLFLATAFISPVQAANGVYDWSKRLGGTSGDSTYGITTDANNNVIITGYVTGDADLNGDGDRTDAGAESGTSYGGADIIISVFNSGGTHQWSKRLGGTGSDYDYSITTDANNNVIITGGVAGNADLNGDGDSTDGGAESSTGYGGNDGFISVFNSGGTHQWSKRLGGTGDDLGWGSTTDANNNVIITGYVTGDADLNGDGDRTDAGAESSIGYGGNDGFISVFNSGGTHQWSKRLGGTGSDNYQGITTDTNNNVIVIGQVTGDADLNGDGDRTDGGAESSIGYGGNDGFISVFNSGGTHQWSKRLGGTGSDYAYGIITDANNNLIVTGIVPGDADLNGDGDRTDGGAESSIGYGGTDGFISVFNSGGTHQWSKRLGGTGSDHGRGITTDTNNNVIVAGGVTGDADLNGDGDRTDGGAESSIGYGSTDGFISVFNSGGTHQWSKRLGGTGYTFVPGITTDTNNNVIVAGGVTGDADLNGDGDRTDGGAESSIGYGGYDGFISVFKQDTAAPGISLTALSPDPTIDTNPVLTGTATDVLGTVTSVEYQMDSISGSWTACTADDGPFDEASEAFTCTVPSALSDGSHTMYIRATDSNTNTTVSGSETSDSFTVDTVVPTGSITLNTGDTYTTTTTITLTLAATDATSGISQMMISNTADFTGAAWETYATSKSWTLITGDGNKTVYVKFKDNAGNVSEVYSDTIIYDSNPPTDEISINSIAVYTKTRDVTLTINASDVLSGVSQMMISETADLSDGTWETYAATKSWTLSTGDGTKTIYIKFKDLAGNISSIFHDSIILDTTQPPLVLLKLNGTNFTSDITTWEVTSTKPPFSGITDAGAIVTITVSGTPLITGTVTAGADGTWSWTPTTDIPMGEHAVTIASTDPAGNTTSYVFTLNVLGVSTTAATLPNTGISLTIILLTILFLTFSGAGTKVILKLQQMLAGMKVNK